VDDGRIKPDIVAPSPSYTTTTTGYRNDLGPATSQSTAVASGVVGLLVELQQRLRPQEPLLASTWKALLIHTAYEAGPHPGPDFRHGYGMLHADAAAFLYRDNHLAGGKPYIKEFIVNNGEAVDFTVTSNGQPLKVTICWSDPAPATQLGQTTYLLDGPFGSLVNDLDLRLISNPGGVTFLPYVLNPSVQAESVAARESAATTSDDSVNNIEQVVLSNPGVSSYRINVSHKGSLQGGPQRLSMIITGVTPASAPQLKIDSLDVVSGSHFVSFPANPGSFYKIYYASDLLLQNWIEIPQFYSALGSRISALVSPPVPHPFYLVKEVSSP
jgi:serine protease AprX